MSRHVSTRCSRLAEHNARRQIPVEGGGYLDDGPVLPFPCPDCYSVESRVIPWEEPGEDKPERPTT